MLKQRCQVPPKHTVTSQLSTVKLAFYSYCISQHRSIHVKIKDGGIKAYFISNYFYFDGFKQQFGSVTGNELPSFNEGSLSWSHHCMKGHSQIREEPCSGPMIPSHRCHFVPCLKKKYQTGGRSIQTACPFVCVQEQRGLFLSAWWESPIGASHMS